MNKVAIKMRRTLKIKFISSLIFLVGVSFLTGCSAGSLKGVDKMALVGIRYNRQIVPITKKEFKSGQMPLLTFNPFQVANKLTGQKSKLLGKLGKLGESEQLFLDRFTDKLIGRINLTSINVVPVSSFSDNPSYQKEKHPDIWDVSYYIPDPYLYPNLQKQFAGKKHKEKSADAVARRLCKALNVDAVASFDMNFVNVTLNKFFVIPMKKLGALGILTVRDKTGKVIYRNGIKVLSTKGKIRFFSDQFSINKKTKKIYMQVEDDFFKQLDQMIDQALSK